MLYPRGFHNWSKTRKKRWYENLRPRKERATDQEIISRQLEKEVRCLREMKQRYQQENA